MPNGGPGPTDPPIIIGDGSVYMSITPKNKKLAWSKWIYRVPRDFTGESMSWSSPVPIRLKEVQTVGRGPYRFPRRAVRWSGLLVVEYSDGTRLQLRPASEDGTGVTIISSRPRREYEESQEGETFILKVPNDARVTGAFFYKLGVRDRIDLFEDQTPYRVMVVYEYERATKKARPAGKKRPAKKTR